MFITARDITERRRAEAQLRWQAIVFDRITDMVLLVDPDGRILDCNPAARQITGHRRDMLLDGLAEVSPELAAACRRCAAIAGDLAGDQT